MTRLAALALIPCLAASPMAAAQSTTPAVVTPAPVTVPADRVTANETRQDLQEILRELPPAVTAVLRHDPSFLTRTRTGTHTRRRPAAPLSSSPPCPVPILPG